MDKCASFTAIARTGIGLRPPRSAFTFPWKEPINSARSELVAFGLAVCMSSLMDFMRAYVHSPITDRFFEQLDLLLVEIVHAVQLAPVLVLVCCFGVCFGGSGSHAIVDV